MRLVKALLGLAICLCLCVPAAASAHANPRKGIWGPATLNGVPQFPLYHDMGVGIYELQVHWDRVAPRRPHDPRNPADAAYSWPPEAADAIAQARQYGIRVMIQIIGAPSWANGGRAWNWAPLRPGDYADFAAAAARRYPSVHLWMVWGEPNRTPNWQPEASNLLSARKLTNAQAAAPRRYARVLDAAYGAFKRVSRRNVVIGGNTSSFGDISAPVWARYMRLANGKPPRLDLYGHNPFSAREPNLSNPPSPDGASDFSDLRRLSAAVDHALGTRKRRHLRLYLSEWTIPTAPGDREFNFWVDPAVQARWITSAFQIVNSWSRIYALAWIHPLDDPPGGISLGGLLDYKGNPKPGYAAFRDG